MRRREFITLVGGAALLLPRAARAQEPGRTYRIGSLTYSLLGNPLQLALLDELRRLGFIEGQNLTIDPRGYGLRDEQFPEVAVELVKARVDLIRASGVPAIRAAQQATGTIPIFGEADDMVGSGLVASMAHPGGNTTGVSYLATELDGKRQEILIEIVPSARRIATLADPKTAVSGHFRALEDAARARGIELSIYPVAKLDEVSGAIDAAKEAGAQALNVLASPLLYAGRQLIIERAAAVRLAAIYQWPETTEEGGLAGYGPRFSQFYRNVVARQLAKLLNGAKPPDLPIEQPTIFELVINLKTAKALDLTIPPAILGRADKVIE